MRNILTILAVLAATVTTRIAAEAPSYPDSNTDAPRRVIAFRPTEYEEDESEGWRTFKDERFSIRIPEYWHVYLQLDSEAEETTKEPTWEYMICNEDGVDVIDLTVVDGGPEYIACFCKPPDGSCEYAVIDGCKLWAYAIDFSALSVDGRSGDASSKDVSATKGRVVKAAGRRYRIDIHASAAGKDVPKVFHVAESVRPTQ